MPNDHFSNGKKIAFTVVMFLYINLALTIFWILKPLKKSLFIGLYDGDQTFKLGSMEMLGSSAELLAKGMNLFIAFMLVIFLTLVTRLAKRQRRLPQRWRFEVCAGIERLGVRSRGRVLRDGAG